MEEVKKEEDKYIVIKKRNLDDHIAYARSVNRGSWQESEKRKDDIEAFLRVMHIIGTTNKYVVCNQDEPYAEKVWQTILDGERDKRN